MELKPILYLYNIKQVSIKSGVRENVSFLKKNFLF